MEQRINKDFKTGEIMREAEAIISTHHQLNTNIRNHPQYYFKEETLDWTGTTTFGAVFQILFIYFRHLHYHTQH